MSTKAEPVSRDPDDEVCGDTYDHDLKLMDERDGITVEVCRNCGAELMTDENGEEV